MIVDNKPIALARDAGYMIRWIDRLVEIARDKSDSIRFPDEGARNEVLSDYAEARSKYEQIKQDAQDTWGDE